MKGALAFALLMLAVGPARAEAAEPKPEILGVRIGMDQQRARGRLAQLGKLEREERKRQEVWRIKDPRYTHLLVGFDTEGKVRYVTAVARPKGKRVRYSEIGDPQRATRTDGSGQFKYVWEIEDERGGKYVVMARGANPDFLDTWSVKKLE